MPQLSTELLQYWLRAMFDCEGWVEYDQSKYRRLVRFESCNENSIWSMKEQLANLGIESRTNKRLNRQMWRLDITGRENLQKFHDKVGFLHDNKRALLSNALSSYK